MREHHYKCCNGLQLCSNMYSTIQEAEVTRSSPIPPTSNRRPQRSPRLQSARRSARNMEGLSLNEQTTSRSDTRDRRKLNERGSLRRDKMAFTSSNRLRIRAASPLRDDAFRTTPSQKAALTKVKMKIRGGGGSDEEMHRTPVSIKQRRAKHSKFADRGVSSGSLMAPTRNKKIEKSPILKKRRHNSVTSLTQV